MKKSNHNITDWLAQYGDPEIIEAIEKAMYENPELAREFRHARVLEKTDKARELFKSLLLRAGISY